MHGFTWKARSLNTISAPAGKIKFHSGITYYRNGYHEIKSFNFKFFALSIEPRPLDIRIRSDIQLSDTMLFSEFNFTEDMKIEYLI